MNVTCEQTGCHAVVEFHCKVRITRAVSSWRGAVLIVLSASCSLSMVEGNTELQESCCKPASVLLLTSFLH